MRLIIFSDLDGTLLDHDTYDWRPAAHMIERIRDEGWPLVFVTSKTRAEVERLRLDMKVDEPFIVENGAAAFFPSGYDRLDLPGAVAIDGLRALVFGRPYAEARDFLSPRRARFGLEGFGDMTVERIGEITGLSAAAAEDAARRDFTEPFRLDDDGALAELSSQASEAGFAVTTGGRLHHLIGAGQDKGTAVRAVQAAFERAWGGGATTVGLGDGANDVPMLEAVAYPVLVPAAGRPLPSVTHPRARVAPLAGPAGWAAALAAVIDELEGGSESAMR